MNNSSFLIWIGRNQLILDDLSHPVKYFQVSDHDRQFHSHEVLQVLILSLLHKIWLFFQGKNSISEDDRRVRLHSDNLKHNKVSLESRNCNAIKQEMEN